MPAPLLLKQLVAIIDDRTTVLCLDAAGQIQAVDDPFDTLAGEIFAPPLHYGCRDTVMPWLAGMVNDQRRAANAELQLRPEAQRRKGPNGEIGAKIPGRPPQEVIDAQHVPEDPVQALADLYAQGVTDREKLGGGRMAASVEKVTLADGTKAVVKKSKKSKPLEAATEAFAMQVANAVGIDDMYVAKVDKHVSVMTFAEGTPGADFLKKALERKPGQSFQAYIQAGMDAAGALKNGREIGLLDWLIANPDRHTLNWVVDEAGAVWPLDHGEAKFEVYRLPYWGSGLQSGFAKYALGITMDQGEILGMSPKFTAAELSEIRSRLESIAAGLKDPEAGWMKNVLLQLEHVERQAK